MACLRGADIHLHELTYLGVRHSGIDTAVDDG